MKKPRLLFAATLLAASSLSAATQTWDTTSGDGATITVASGTWDKTVTNWNNGSTNGVWVDGNTAVFGGTTAPVITIGGDVLTAGTITFNGSGSAQVIGALGNLNFTNLQVSTTGSGKLSITSGITSALTSTGTITIASGSTIYVSGTTNDTLANAITVSGTGNTENLGALRIEGGAVLSGAITLAGNTSIGSNTGTGTLSGVISGAFGLNKVATGTNVLSGANTYTGGTTVTAGTLSLDYSTQDNSKLSDTAALTFSGGTLNQTGGTHVEQVASTTLTTGTSSTLTRTSGTAQIALGAITGNGTLNITTGVATTTNTLQSNGTLGAGITFNNGLATLSGATITGVTYTNVAVGGVIADASNHVAITGAAAGNVTLGGVGVTTIGTLTQLNTAATTIDTTTNSLRLGSQGIVLAGVGTGALTIGTSANAGTLTAGGANNTAGSIAFNSGAAITVNSTITDNGTGSVSVSKIGSGTLTLAGTNTYGGTTTVNGGTLALSGTNTGNGAFIVNAGTLALSGTNSGSGNFTVNGGTLALSGTDSGAGSFTVNGGTLAITGTITGGGNTTVNTGTVTVNNNAALGTGTVFANASYGTSYSSGGAAFLKTTVTGLNIANNLVVGSTAGYYALQMGAAAGGTVQWSGVISGGGTGVVLQIDTPNSSDGTSSATLSGNNTFAGQIRLNRGTLTLTNANAAGTADIYLQSNANAAGNLVFSNSYTLANKIIFGSTSANTISTGVNNVTASGVISSSATSWSKAGSGALTLTGTNTFGGTLNINAGSIVTGNTAALGVASVSVVSGATLQIGNATVNTVTLGAGATLAIAAGATLKFANIASAITLQGAGGYTFGTSTIDLGNVFNVAGSYNLITGGTGTKTEGAYSFVNTSAGFNYAFNAGVLTVTAVPEPSTYGLLGAGALAFASLVRRRRKTV